MLEGMEADVCTGWARSTRCRGEDDSTGTPSERIGDIDPELEAVHERIEVERDAADPAGREQTIVYLRFFEGLTQSEIAEPSGSVRCTCRGCSSGASKPWVPYRRGRGVMRCSTWRGVASQPQEGVHHVR